MAQDILRQPLQSALPAEARRTQRRLRGRLLLPLLVAGLVVLPILNLLSALLNPSFEMWQRLWETILPRMLVHTLLLLGGVGALTLLIGTGMAWLVTAYSFPLRAFFERALLLPLAVPSFVIGFVYMATFDFAGPVQTTLRAWFGQTFRAPDIRSGWGAILVMSLVLYPYVYLLARAAFREQALTTYEAARVMGYTRTQAFFRLIIPLARPSLVAGTALAMMEAMTDFATVRFFSFPTISEGIVRLWEGRMDRAGAIELSLLLLGVALCLILLERALRGKARYYQSGILVRRPPRLQLRGTAALLAVGANVLLLGFAFVLPVGQLAAWALSYVRTNFGGWRSVFGQYALNTFGLAALAAILTVFLALLIANGVRLRGGRAGRIVARLATLGYALPGAVIAAGVLLTLAPIDRAINDLAQQLNLSAPGLILTGTIVGLMYAYTVRFMSVAFNSVEASLEKVKPSMEQAARTMGASPLRVLWRIHLPLVSQGMVAAAILVFVDVMKELPATVMLRPFGMDTLAIWTYMAAAESFWEEASLPALTILAVGLIPVWLLMRVGSRAEP
ncbi:MAG: iron ABC transporter permease [Candidatus Thermofonsia Clade 1 bacterium]|uniref:Iron ABC transporter permease n=1 Tax=Candidatus Thermofonsia Clade 1 bacterium TaxID=2364210 RepID=A0A2M8PH47_9CHLR|nr:MAG: iron ABC transporter permease [Candidatus Thermofonsia Clade 1 bacterium]